MNNCPKEILFFTRALCPPWDEASKNLAYEIIKKIQGNFVLRILTTQTVDEKIFAKDKSSLVKIIPEKIFSGSHSKTKLKIQEKFQFIRRLFYFPIKADILHFFFTPRAFTSFIIRARLFFGPQIKTIQTIATLAPALYDQPDSIKKILFADVLVCQSQHTKKKLNALGFVNVQTIYPGIDLIKYSPQEKNPSLLEKFQLEAKDFIVLFPGEYVRLKAMDNLLEAAEAILKEKEHLNCKFILACRLKSEADVAKKQAVVQWIKVQGFQKNFIFIDTFDDMPSLYNLVDLVIFPVQEMTGKFDIPLAIIEPMACQKPVIVSDVEVLKEFIQHRQNGLVFKKDNPSSLAKAILEIKANPALKMALSQKAFEYVQANFNITKTVKVYEAIYKKL